MKSLPQSIVLPTTPDLNVVALSAAFNGASRAKIHWWRVHNNFPKTVRRGITNTAEVAAWARRNGCKIWWI